VTLGGAILALVAGTALGLISSSSADLALPFAVGVLIVALSAIDPRVMLVLAVPGTLLMARIGGDLVSLSDVLLAGATVTALVIVRPKGSAALRTMLWSGTAYLALTVPTLVLNPYTANVVEWVHEVVLVLGSMVAGYALGLSGAASVALWLYLGGSAVIAVAALSVAVADLVTTGQSMPVYVLGLHKNFIGGSLATAAVIALAHPPWMRGSRRWANILGCLALLGIVASQSRQAIAAVVVGLAVVAFAGTRRHGWLRLLTPVAAIVAAVLLVVSVNEQLASDNRHNSAFVRLNIFERSVEIWQSSPLFGVGMRWWYTDRFPGGFQPPNAELEVLTTTGVAGMIGFVVLFAGALFALSKLDRAYRTIAVAVVVTRLVQSQFDLYWVAGQSAMLWIVAGIAVGVSEREKATTPRTPLPGSDLAAARAH
jgi:O-antigen ligase